MNEQLSAFKEIRIAWPKVALAWCLLVLLFFVYRHITSWGLITSRDTRQVRRMLRGVDEVRLNETVMYILHTPEAVERALANNTKVRSSTTSDLAVLQGEAARRFVQNLVFYTDAPDKSYLPDQPPHAMPIRGDMRVTFLKNQEIVAEANYGAIYSSRGGVQYRMHWTSGALATSNMPVRRGSANYVNQIVRVNSKTKLWEQWERVR